MSDVYMYADETGNLDYNVSGAVRDTSVSGLRLGRVTTASTSGRLRSSGSSTLRRASSYRAGITPKTTATLRVRRSTS